MTLGPVRVMGTGVVVMMCVEEVNCDHCDHNSVRNRGLTEYFLNFLFEGTQNQNFYNALKFSHLVENHF